MIARLSGTIIENEGSAVVVDCGGVGYFVTVTSDDQSRLLVGDSAELYIAENIKEDIHDLYGFRAKSRKELYLQLTSVNGVGPKAAMAILAVDGEDEIRRAIAEGDTVLLSRANGVGKKVAERIVVDLKNKVGLLASDDATDFLRDDSISDHDEAVQALVSLGYSVIDAKFALSTVDADLPLDKRVKLALKG
jgi:Holliday junction DNA helicase RuvA